MAFAELPVEQLGQNAEPGAPVLHQLRTGEGKSKRNPPRPFHVVEKILLIAQCLVTIRVLYVTLTVSAAS
jgi:hypothetical protein